MDDKTPKKTRAKKKQEIPNPTTEAPKQSQNQEKPYAEGLERMLGLNPNGDTKKEFSETGVLDTLANLSGMKIQKEKKEEAKDKGE